ncbi:MAG: membrane protein insertion efficiency factor YidD [Syntrophobacterales bacterium]|nr:MAG: membrane protein insertion efficiency factor YidD [Syntrophobacterales bacterium]
MQRVKKLLVFLIRSYQVTISPYFPQRCRFYPTCSEYAIMAIERHGPIKGVGLGLLRILRCNPFNPGGYDPVK